MKNWPDLGLGLGSSTFVSTFRGDIWTRYSVFKYSGVLWFQKAQGEYAGSS